MPCSLKRSGLERSVVSRLRINNDPVLICFHSSIRLPFPPFNYHVCRVSEDVFSVLCARGPLHLRYAPSFPSAFCGTSRVCRLFLSELLLCGGQLPDWFQIASLRPAQLVRYYPAVSRGPRHKQGVVSAPPNFQRSQTTVRAQSSSPAWTDDHLGALQSLASKW